MIGQSARVGWHPFAAGASIGETGSEGGTVVIDEEHSDGAWITLEDGGYVAPWSITYGVYGWMVHTRFFQNREEAETSLAAMKDGLEHVLSSDEPNRFRRFVERFP